MVVRLTAVFMSLSDNMHQMTSQLECVTRQINTVTASMKKWVFIIIYIYTFVKSATF